MKSSTDPYARRAQIFPVLSAGQLECLKRLGSLRRIEPGEVLFDFGDRLRDFIIIVSGKLRVTVATCKSEEEIVVHGPGEFTGEIDMFSNRRSIVRGTVIEAGDILFIPHDGFRRLVAQHPDLAELVTRAFILRRVGLIEHQQGDVIVLGANHAGGTHAINRFLSRNGHPYRYVNVETDTNAPEILRAFNLSPADLPAVVIRGSQLLTRPTLRAIADELGLSEPREALDVYDLAIVGSGPAGLAAAVYGASEGLRVIVIEGEAPGGQAGTSSKIENYPGFPTGISGHALAGRALTQAQKFGADVITPRVVQGLDCRQWPFVLDMGSDAPIRARSIVVACGAEYRRLGLERETDYEGAGIYYGATFVEASLCTGQDVVVVGGANSAGQAAIFLSGLTRHVHMLIRGSGLKDSMSHYLIERIGARNNITLHTHTELIRLSGNTALESLVWRNNRTGETPKQSIQHLFVMIGAQPNTRWLNGCVQLDGKRFIKTGNDLSRDDLATAGWNRERSPLLMETSQAGIFAVGDVRSGSVKRVASAIGEGSIAVQSVHAFLNEALP